jgi:hypothetical protein
MNDEPIRSPGTRIFEATEAGDSVQMEVWVHIKTNRSSHCPATGCAFWPGDCLAIGGSAEIRRV